MFCLLLSFPLRDILTLTLTKYTLGALFEVESHLLLSI